MVSFQEERLEDVLDSIVEIAGHHWEETEEYRHGQRFNPDTGRYLEYAKIGYLRLFTARDGDRLIGYAIMYLSTSMHTQLPIATEDTWFIEPDYRKGRNAIKFYKYVEKEMLKHGVVEIQMTAKLTNKSGRIMEYLGFSHVSNGYSKQFEENIHVRP